MKGFKGYQKVVKDRAKQTEAKEKWKEQSKE